MACWATARYKHLFFHGGILVHFSQPVFWRWQITILRVCQRLVHAVHIVVKAGEYLGQNYGKIMKISETEITLREIVQDASGEWIERGTTLQLQESGR